MRFRRFVWFLPVLLAWSCKDTPPAPEPDPVSYTRPYVNMLLGNPSKAKAQITSPDNYLAVRDQFILGYDNSIGVSTWVSWHLAPEWLGTTPRQDDFRPDDVLPPQFFRAITSDYNGSGFDRGHICPSADRTASKTDNSATFVMSNMLPTAPQVNQDCWEKMETYIRSRVNQGQEIYTISGGYGQGGIGNNGNVAQTIANGKIRVPATLYRIVVILPQGDDDLNRVATEARIIAVAIPNKNSEGNTSWGSFRVSIDAIEAASGLDFLTNLPPDVQAVLETKVDNGPVL
jgi:endonuclease G